MRLDQIACPEWTEYRDKSGLDPLGMQNSSINLYQHLLPGISNVTLRIRYYGLYAWLAAVHAKDGSRSPDIKNWQRLVRRAEALYALVAVHNNDGAGVSGSRWARRHLDASGNQISFSEHADPGSAVPYLRQAWGAYGAAYGSQLFEIGVLTNAAEHDVPVPSQEVGDALAEAFENSSGTKISDRYYEVLRRGLVTRRELDELEPVLPSKIGRNSTERQVYETLLFSRGDLQRREDHSRRDTLMLMLHAANHLGEAPEIDAIRWLLYAASSADGRPLLLSDERLNQQRVRWWVYQANDLLHLSYETLLKFVLDTLADYRMGVPLSVLIGTCVAAILEAAPAKPKSWKDFIRNTKPERNAATEKETGETYLSSICQSSNDIGSRCTAECAWAALRLLAIIQTRAASDLAAIKRELGSLNQQFFRSLITEIEYLSKLAEVDFTTAIVKTIESRIINRHLWVAHRKFRDQGDYTFLIEADDGHVRLRTTSVPVFTNPRLGPALWFLQDIHLIDEKGLTALGKKLVAAK
ncbi:MAG: hypothetical protein PHW76_08100 [Alphaproteobacteria bacterium]|nr:hypothetical protein [Alphaproteobacteria bacterium]